VSLKSVGGVEGDPIQNEEMVLHIGDAETIHDFTDNLRGMSPKKRKSLTSPTLKTMARRRSPVRRSVSR